MSIEEKEKLVEELEKELDSLLVKFPTNPLQVIPDELISEVIKMDGSPSKTIDDEYEFALKIKNLI